MNTYKKITNIINTVNKYLGYREQVQNTKNL